MVLLDEPQIRLMDQRRRLQGVPDALAPQVGSGAPPQLLIHHAQQPVPRLHVPVAPRLEQTAHVIARWWLGVHDALFAANSASPRSREQVSVRFPRLSVRGN